MTTKPDHKWTKPDGTVREYTELSDMPCPVCNPYEVRTNGYMGVLADIEGTTTLECAHCAHTMYVDSRAFAARKLIEEAKRREANE